MCIHSPELIVTGKPILAWKYVAVEKGKFMSPVLPRFRTTQRGYKSKALRREYRIGRTHVSPIGPTAGIYLYKTREDARLNKGYRQTILRVEVPTGTKCLMGYSAFTAARIRVLGVAK